MIKIKIDPLVSSVTMQRQEKLVLLLFTLITLSDFLSLRVVRKSLKFRASVEFMSHPHELN